MKDSTVNMTTDKIVSMLPGPASVYPKVLEAMAHDYDLGHLEADHLALYHETSQKLSQIAGTKNETVLMSGEGMLVLWAALKSCLAPGDVVVSIGTGIFGDGIGSMAAGLGCKVVPVSLPYDSTINCENALLRIEDAIKSAHPKMITGVHCETPSGTLNPLAELGELKKIHNVPLFYVDAVASIGGAEVLGDLWNIDLLLGGTQKCFSAPPGMSFLQVSETAWDIAQKINYQGYDALLPFRKLEGEAPFPYTPYRHGTAALNMAADIILEEGLNECFARHKMVAEKCRSGLEAIGYEIFPVGDAVNSPTVTAVKVPKNVKDWAEWQKKLNRRGLFVGSSFGPMQGKVFRLGHMGKQADEGLVGMALEILADSK